METIHRSYQTMVTGLELIVLLLFIASQISIIMTVYLVIAVPTNLANIRYDMSMKSCQIFDVYSLYRN